MRRILTKYKAFHIVVPLFEFALQNETSNFVWVICHSLLKDSFMIIFSSEGNLTCSVKLTSNNVTRTLTDAYTYNPALTANVTMVTPARGGTAGGTRLSIEGTGFG